MSENQVVRAYNVQFYDSHLEVDDFNTINADSEEDARNKLLDERDGGEDRYTIQEVTEAYVLDKTKIERLLGDLETI
jgi:hypothetical protein